MAWAKIDCATTCCCDLDLLCICPSTVYSTYVSHILEGAQPVRTRVTYNADGCMNYAHRNSDNGSETTTGCLASINLSCNAGNDGDFLIIEHTFSISCEEKISLGQMAGRGAAGSTAPVREEHAYMWDNTAAEITRKDITNDNSGTWGNCSTTAGWGTD